MLNRMTIRKKMMLFIVGITVLIYMLTLGYISWWLREKSISDAKGFSDISAQQQADSIRSQMEGYLAVSRAMSALSKGFIELPPSERFSRQQELLSKVQESNPDFKVTWISWDMAVLDPNWKQPYGRERNVMVNLGDRVKQVLDTTDVNEADSSSFYYFIRETGKEGLAEPYPIDKNNLLSENLILGTSIVVPIKDDDQYLGQVGFDFELKKFHQEGSEQIASDQSHSFLISYRGRIVAHSEASYVNKYIDVIPYMKDRNLLAIRDEIGQGRPVSFTAYDEATDQDIYMSFAPVPVGNSDIFWAVGTAVPFSKITAAFDSRLRETIGVGLVGLILLSVIVSRIAVNITNSLDKSNTVLKKLAKGEFDVNYRLETNGGDELSEIANSVNILLDDLLKKAAFSEDIGEGNLGASFESSGDKDVLGNSLIAMRANLTSALEQITGAVEEAGEHGNLSTRIDSENRQGVWRDLAESINNLLSSVSRPFNSLNEIVNAMADGDLSKRFSGEAKGDVLALANHLNTALDNLNTLLFQIISNANEVRASSDEMLVSSTEMNSTTAEIASAIGQMSRGAQNQVVQVDQSSSLVEDILKSSADMEERANGINKTAQRGAESSDAGLSLMEKMSFSMKDISAFTEDTNKSFRVLSQRSKDISRVLGVITEIASQTNLLALNAAIEAAQAGDAGRGFAVVAEEIRKLAEDSKRSAQEIERLVVGVRQDTETAAQVIEVMSDSVRGGEGAAREASEAFKEIASSSVDTLALSEKILEAAKNQISDIKDVVNITESVVVIAEQTAAGTEEVASSASELSAGMESYTQKSSGLSQISAALKEGVEKFLLKQEEEGLS